MRVQAPPVQRLHQQPVQELEPEFVPTQPPVPVHAQVPVQVPQVQAQGQNQTNEVEDTPVSNHGQFVGLKLIPNPPDLEAWREKLFHVDDTITLTEEE